MASKIAVETQDTLNIACVSGTVEGDGVNNGFITGIAMRDRDTNGFTTIKIPRTSTVRVTALASTTAGCVTTGSAIALGDKMYYDTVTKSFSKDSGGKFLGYALGTPDTTTGGYASGTQIASGVSASCDILLIAVGS